MSKLKSTKYPLTGFGKISWEEFLGIMDMLELFRGLDKENKNLILYVMDGMKYRELKGSKNEN